MICHNPSLFTYLCRTEYSVVIIGPVRSCSHEIVQTSRLPIIPVKNVAVVNIRTIFTSLNPFFSK